MTILIIAIVIGIVLAGFYIYYSFKNPAINYRKYVRKHMAVYGTKNKGTSLNKHDKLKFYSPEDIGM